MSKAWFGDECVGIRFYICDVEITACAKIVRTCQGQAGFNSLHTDPISEWMNGCCYKAVRLTLQASLALVPRHRHLTEKRRWPSAHREVTCSIQLVAHRVKDSLKLNTETVNGFSDRSLGGFFDPSIQTWTLRKFFEATSTDTCGRKCCSGSKSLSADTSPLSWSCHCTAANYPPMYLCLLDFGLSSVLQKGCLRLHWVL